MSPAPPATAAPPRVSVVMATYNRSNIIGHAIRALQAQTLGDWELIVVGDACTDDTAQVVAAFADPRIRYLELAQNCGEQSGPNNAGVALARAPFLAFLNHDDLWLPEHLAVLLAALEDAQADLVFSIGLVAWDADRQRALTGATTRHGRYHTSLMPSASLWLMRRALADRIGPWRRAVDLRVAPSQDWLHRAQRAGAQLLALPRLTAVLLPSGGDAGSYRDRHAATHEAWVARLREPEALLRELLSLQLRWEDARLNESGARLAGEAMRAAGRWLLRRLGVFPSLPSLWLRYARRGAFIRQLRRTRGLPATPPFSGENP